MTETMSTRDFLRHVLTSPRASCQVDLPGLGDAHESGTALYLIVDAERANGWHLASDAPADARVCVVHVISRHSRGEVRGYVWIGDELRVRYPASPEEWPELDALVSEAFALPVRAAKGAA